MNQKQEHVIVFIEGNPKMKGAVPYHTFFYKKYELGPPPLFLGYPPVVPNTTVGDLFHCDSTAGKLLFDSTVILLFPKILFKI